MLIQWLRPYYSEDDGGGSGAGDAGDVKASDIINRYGKNEDAALRMAEVVADLNNKLYKLRSKNRDLTQANSDLTAKLPADGAVVLPKDAAAELEQYRALGAKPADLKAALEAKVAAEGKLSQLTRAEQIRAAAEIAGYKPSVLTMALGDLEVQTKTDKDNKPIAVVVKDGAETPLTTYAEQAWQDLLPALAVKHTPQPQSYDINAGARGGGGQTPDDILNANRQRLLGRR
jgi:hypothetical protein